MKLARVITSQSIDPYWVAEHNEQWVPLNGDPWQGQALATDEVDCEAEISFLSQDTTLLTGTVIMTGTPQGIGWLRQPKRLLQPGDEVRVEIDGIGTLINPVVK